MTTREFKKLSGRSKSWISRAVKSGKLKAKRINDRGDLDIDPLSAAQYVEDTPFYWNLDWGLSKDKMLTRDEALKYLGIVHEGALQRMLFDGHLHLDLTGERFYKDELKLRRKEARKLEEKLLWQGLIW